MSFAFDPTNGYRNTTDFPTKPASETEFRDSMQGLLDQIRDYINTDLPQLPPSTETWTAPTLLNSWVNFSGSATCGYYKDDLKIVHLRGFLKSGAINQNMFVLPTGFRPLTTLVIAAVSNNGTSDIISRFDINANGAVTPQIGGNSFFSIDGVSFRAEQ